jgi:hypothetical protein
MSRNQIFGMAALVVALVAAVVVFVIPSGHSASGASSSTSTGGSGGTGTSPGSAARGDRATASTASIQAPSFIAPVPAGWNVRARANAKGAHQFQLGSTKAPINALGIGPSGTVGVTVTEYSPEALARGHIAGKPAGSYSPVALLPFLVGQPARAEGVQVAQHGTATALAGAAAAEEAFFYGYRGRENLQVDVVAKHDGRLFLIELDAEPRLASASQGALGQILGGWRFR